MSRFVVLSLVSVFLGCASVPSVVNRGVQSEKDATVGVIAEFMLGGKTFEVVRVYWPGQAYIPGNEVIWLPMDEVIRRADTEGRVVRSEADWNHVWKYRQELPVLKGHWFYTARLHSVYPHSLSCLFRRSHEWFEGWTGLDTLLNDSGGLVLRLRE